MMADHTPGPWTIEYRSYGDEWWFGGEGAGQYVIMGPGDGLVHMKSEAQVGLWRSLGTVIEPTPA